MGIAVSVKSFITPRSLSVVLPLCISSNVSNFFLYFEAPLDNRLLRKHSGQTNRIDFHHVFWKNIFMLTIILFFCQNLEMPYAISNFMKAYTLKAYYPRVLIQVSPIFIVYFTIDVPSSLLYWREYFRQKGNYYDDLGSIENQHWFHHCGDNFGKFIGFRQ
jgi:hypothetical protein